MLTLQPKTLSSEKYERLEHRFFETLYRFFFSIPLSQLILLIIGTVLFHTHEHKYFQFVLLAIFITIFAVFFLLFDLFLYLSILQYIRKNVSKEYTQWLETMLSEQFEFFDRTMKEIKSTAFLRHDIRNLLQTAYTLMRQNENDKAESILQDVSETMNLPVYCSNKVVNAILAVKGDILTQNKIHYTFDVSLPEKLPFPDLILCSLFTNILDNACQAALQCSEETRSLYLNCYLKDHLLVLSCRNSIVKDSFKIPTKKEQNIAILRGEKHGLGLSILQDILNQYHGEMDYDIDDTEVTVRLFLQSV